MTMTRAAALLVSIGASLTAVGCGDDKPSGFRTGVDGSKTIGTATPAEAEQICRSTETWARAQLADSKQRELACRIEALGAAASGLLAPGANPTGMPAQLQTTCRATLDQCLAAGAPSAMPSMAACPSFPPTCTATVAEYEACLNDVPPFVDKSAASLPTCETLNPVSLLALASLVSTAPASCQTFQMKCGVAGIPGIPGIPGAPRGTLTPRP